MDAKQGIILVIFFMALAGEIGCYPSQVPAKDGFEDCLTQEVITAFTNIPEQEDVLETAKSILKHIPFKKYLVPIFKKILVGISKSKNPIDILLDIISVLEKGKKKKKQNKKNQKKENSSSKEEERAKEEKENKASGSGESDEKSQEDIPAEIHPKFKITGPEAW